MFLHRDVFHAGHPRARVYKNLLKSFHVLDCWHDVWVHHVGEVNKVAVCIEGESSRCLSSKNSTIVDRYWAILEISFVLTPKKFGLPLRNILILGSCEKYEYWMDTYWRVSVILAIEVYWFPPASAHYINFRFLWEIWILDR